LLTLRCANENNLCYFKDPLHVFATGSHSGRVLMGVGKEMSKTWQRHDMCSEKKHPLMFYVMSLWKMLRFPQNLQKMFFRKRVFRKWKS